MAQAGRVAPEAFAHIERVRATIARYGMLDGGETVVVGVSGGPDSVALLDILARARLDLNLVVAHIDHRLSPDSEDIAARVSATAAKIGYEVHLARAPDLEGPNVHARARDFRYEFFDIVADRVDATRIATGHTLDDRVETTVARLIHGAGTEGLAGLPPVEGRRIRPALDLRRAETRSYCEMLGLEFHDDPANVDLRFERPAVRARVVASIEEHWGEGAVRAMAQSSERLREDAVALRALADRLYTQIAVGDEGEVAFQRANFVAVPRALRRRLLERAVGRVRDRAAGIDEVLDHLDAAGEDGAEKRFALAGHIEVVVGPGNITVSRMAR